MAMARPRFIVSQVREGWVNRRPAYPSHPGPRRDEGRQILCRHGAADAVALDQVAAQALQERLLDRIAETPLAKAELLNPLTGDPHARFLAFRHPEAQHWYEQLKRRNVITDVRGDVLRIGFGIYQDEADVDRLVEHLGELA